MDERPVTSVAHEISARGCAIALHIERSLISESVRHVSGDVYQHQTPFPDAKGNVEFAALLQTTCLELSKGAPVQSVCVVLPGEIDALGAQYLIPSPRLGIAGTNGWQEILKKSLGSAFSLVNSVEAFALGVADRARLPHRGNVGVILLSNDPQFCVIRDGRWWKPGRRANSLGTLRTSEDNSSVSDHLMYDIDVLARIAAKATAWYQLNHIIIGQTSGNSPQPALTGTEVSRFMIPLLPSGVPAPIVELFASADEMLLHGATALAWGNMIAEPARFSANYAGLHTELPASAQTDDQPSAHRIVQDLWQAEQDAGQRMQASLEAIAALSVRISEALPRGGRVIYVGAGTSGRLAALDAVEMPCTYSTSPDQFVAVIAGGTADAALTIEENFEEDSSAVADLLLLQPSGLDIVVGISASGSAFFVRSALAFARDRGAYTVLIHEGAVEPAFFDADICLQSGSELVSGSTRMKAGTATKKVLNFLSTTAMILLGKVQAGYMTDFECPNVKLRQRAQRILRKLADLDDDRAEALLRQHNYRLRDAIDAVRPPTNGSLTGGK